jgi:hypothetical protein
LHRKKNAASTALRFPDLTFGCCRSRDPMDFVAAVAHDSGMMSYDSKGRPMVVAMQSQF